MTVERGRDWGERRTKPTDLILAASDRAAIEAIEAARRANRPIPQIGLVGGDLWRTLGGPSAPDLRTATEATHATTDLGAVLVDGRLHWFLAHLVARRSWLRGRVVVVANAAFHGAWNLAPRAHPGDGRLDVLDAASSLGIGDRLKARRRLRSGTHLPHPAIRTRRVEAIQIDLEPAADVYLDGRRLDRAHSLSVRVEKDAVPLWF